MGVKCEANANGMAVKREGKYATGMRMECEGQMRMEWPSNAREMPLEWESNESARANETQVQCDGNVNGIAVECQ